MTSVTHFLAGTAAAYAAGAEPLVSAAAGFAAVLPDIDTPGSFIGKKLPFFSFFFRHRGFTHSLMFAVLVYLLVYRFLGVELALYAAAGFGSHILLDMLNPSGVELFWPLTWRVSILKIRTGGFCEILLLAGLAAAVLVIRR